MKLQQQRPSPELAGFVGFISPVRVIEETMEF
jgi:hypothetical protein